VGLEKGSGSDKNSKMVITVAISLTLEIVETILYCWTDWTYITKDHLLIIYKAANEKMDATIKYILTDMLRWKLYVKKSILSFQCFWKENEWSLNGS
jgi:hypothetical protein